MLCTALGTSYGWSHANRPPVDTAPCPGETAWGSPTLMTRSLYPICNSKPCTALVPILGNSAETSLL